MTSGEAETRLLRGTGFRCRELVNELLVQLLNLLVIPRDGGTVRSSGGFLVDRCCDFLETSFGHLFKKPSHQSQPGRLLAKKPCMQEIDNSETDTISFVSPKPISCNTWQHYAISSSSACVKAVGFPALPPSSLYPSCDHVV